MPQCYATGHVSGYASGFMRFKLQSGLGVFVPGLEAYVCDLTPHFSPEPSPEGFLQSSATLTATLPTTALP